MINRRTPLAWSMLVHDKMRFVLSMTGVAFGVFLMFIEMGFLNGVYDSQTMLLQHFNADLVMVHRLKDSVAPDRPFSRRRLTDVLQFDGVAAVYPVYLNGGSGWKAFGGRINPMTVLAFDPKDPVLLLPELDQFRDALQEPNTAIADSRSRLYFGPLEKDVVAELNRRKVRILGNFSLCSDFRVDGRLIMSDRNFVTLFPDRQTGRPNFNRIEYGLIKVKEGIDPKRLCRQIQASLPADVRVVTKDALVQEEIRFWAVSEPVGIVFGLGMVVGFVIGVTICYQILFTDVNDHQQEFATLKAIGYANRFLVGVVLKEGIFLSLTAYPLGLAISIIVYRVLEDQTRISMQLTPARAILVFVLAVTMCLVSAVLAVRKVLRSDPAEVF